MPTFYCAVNKLVWVLAIPVQFPVLRNEYFSEQVLQVNVFLP
jgi:hypothetical protein